MSEKLYERCPVCLRHKPRCVTCDGTGFIDTGLTTAQVERWATWERWLNADPGLPHGDAAKARDYILGRLKTLGHGPDEGLLAAIRSIAELDGDCEQQEFKLTRFQASQIARQALHAATGT